MLNANVGANKNDYCSKIKQIKLRFIPKLLPLPVSINDENI